MYLLDLHDYIGKCRITKVSGTNLLHDVNFRNKNENHQRVGISTSFTFRPVTARLEANGHGQIGLLCLG